MGEEPENTEEIIEVIDGDPEPAPDPKPVEDPKPVKDPKPVEPDPDAEPGSPGWAADLRAGVEDIQAKLTVRDASDKEKTDRRTARKTRRKGYRADVRTARAKRAAEPKKREPKVKLFKR